MIDQIVVGVDGSDHSRHALRYAIEEARRHHAKLTIVHVYSTPTPIAMYGPTVPTGPAREDLQQAGRDLIDRVMGIHPSDVDIEYVVTDGPAAATLVRLAEGADLLVVGSRGRGGFRGLLLGSTSHQVISHAPCPVLVVPARAGTTPDAGDAP